MNKYLTFTGLQPVYLGDIDFLQESVRSAFLMLLKGLTDQEKPNCILKRATAEADGVICLEGEIMPYKAYTGSMLGNYTYEVVSSFDGERDFKDGETHACYETRYAQEKLGIGVPGMPTFDTLLFSRLKVKQVAENNYTETINRIAKYTILGNSVTVQNSFEFLAEDTVEYLCQSEVMSILDNSVISQFPMYCPFVAESNGALISVPAKVTLDPSDTYPGAVTMTVKINQTKFPAGSKGQLSFTVVKQTI